MSFKLTLRTEQKYCYYYYTQKVLYVYIHNNKLGLVQSKLTILYLATAPHTLIKTKVTCVFWRTGACARAAKKKNMAAFKRSFSGLLFLFWATGQCVAEGGNCMELGYSPNLMCSSCRELKEFNLQSLEEECNQCCQPDGTNTDDKVSKTENYILIKTPPFL